jgi:hypothetical protein
MKEAIILLLPVFFGLHRMWQFKAGVTHREPYSALWHGAQGALQICITLLIYQLEGWQGALFFVFWFWLVFDGLANIGLGKPWFYVGETAITDKIQRWIHKKVLRIWTVEAWSAIAKVSKVIGSFLIWMYG